MIRRAAALLIAFIPLLLAAPAFGLSIIDQDPHIGMYENFTFDPMRIRFDDSIDPATANGTTVTVAYENTPAMQVPISIAVATDLLANDTLILTPTNGKWPFATRLELQITDGLESAGGAPFDESYPFEQVFVANVPADLERGEWDGVDPFGFVALFTNSNVLLGFNPINPESTDPSKPETIPGMSATEAWKITAGRPEIVIAVVDTGMETYDHDELGENLFINAGELPAPTDGGAPCSPDPYDCTDDGKFNIRDYDNDPAFASLGRPPHVGDLFDAFEDGVDDDGNGFTDDICGWDFLRDVNVALGVRDFPEGGHGEDRGKDGAAAADNGVGDKPGYCPRCMTLPIRVADGVMSEVNILAEGVQYAQDMGAQVAVFASGSLDHHQGINELFTEISEAGTTLVGVASDELGYHHAFTGSCDDVISVKGIFPIPPVEIFGFLPMETFGFTENLTMWGESVLVSGSSGSASSEAAGNISGLVALIYSRALDLGIDLSANEVKQILTMTSDDIKDHCMTITGGGCQPGWEAHFGYGRPNALSAVEALGDPDLGIAPAIPPEVKFRAPGWFTIFDPEQSPSVDVAAYIFARGESYDWDLQVAVGKEPRENKFTSVASGSGTAAIDDVIGSVDISGLFAEEIYNNPPDWSFDFTVTLRIQVTTTNDDKATILGEDRRTIAVHRDQDENAGLMPGFPIDVRASGEASPTLYDLDGDPFGTLEIIVAGSDGLVQVYAFDGEDYAMMDGFPIEISDHTRPIAYKDVSVCSPVVADLFGTGEPYIVVTTAGGAALAIHRNGNLHTDSNGDPAPILDGFPVYVLDPDNSSPESFAHGNGFVASPVAGDLNGDGMLEIIVPNNDGNVYAWTVLDNDGDGMADPAPGFPVYAKSEAGNVDGSKICNGEQSQFRPQILGTPIVGVFDPDHADPDISGYPSIFVGTSEVCDESLIKTTRFYGIYHDGYDNDSGSAFLPGWPLKLSGPLADALPVPPVAIGITSSPAMARHDGKTYIGISSVLWLPQLIVWDGEKLNVQSLPSKLSFNLLGNGSFGRLGPNNELHYTLPGMSALDIIDRWISVMRPTLSAWNMNDPGTLAFNVDLEDSAWYVNPAIADISGDGENEMIAGEGGFMVHAYDLAGNEPAQWPKFTNGWTVAAPSVGDLDGDGMLEVVVHTREGHLFAWNTVGEACNEDGLASDWWTFHHDEHNSGVYGKDTIPPAVVTDLEVYNKDYDADTFVMSFTSPGDDWNCGTPAGYDIRYARTAEELETTEGFLNAKQVDATIEPVAGGEEVGIDFELNDSSVWFAVQTIDEVGNLSSISKPTSLDDCCTPDDDEVPDDEGSEDGDEDNDAGCCG
jgi:hypothetical protein